MRGSKNVAQVFLSSDLKWLSICPVAQTHPCGEKRTWPGCGNIGFSESGHIIFDQQASYKKLRKRPFCR
jgi:hypothetical protein